MTALASTPYPLRWFSVLAVFFSVLCLPLLLSTRESNYTWDEASYHLPAVRQIREHWPKLDLLHDSLSATAPGYHYFLAGVSFLTTAQRLPLRLVNFAVSLAVLGLLWRIWPAATSPRLVLAAVLPLAVSNFFVKSASYLVTDNAALLAITGALCALCFARAETATRWAAGLATAAVCIRQSSIWLVAPLAIRTLANGRRPRLEWLAIAPPLLVLVCLVAAWHGVVPPAWHENHYASAGLVPAAGAYALAVLGLLGAAYYAAGRPAGSGKEWLNFWTGSGALLGLAVALAGPNSPNYGEGRWGGYLWDLAARLPSGNTYSPLFVMLAPLGGAMLAMLVRQLWVEAGRTAALTWLAAYAAWFGSGLSNRQIFHRYYEPVTLVLLICWLALILRARPAAGQPRRISLLVLLSGAQLLLTVVTAHGRTFGFL